ncbi:hypothetical protein J2848_005705 [Azospirillum lipoferum]|uniref:Uncharacterized protein n=1 Tax=Azospirillum lipoferum TaxID=193 RepID=A0A5A9GI38_AZOLI|nr:MULTISPECIES: hypothetical protein [Azospirillum]KAA0592939.1 hypothetical protein FZ942_25790 [Azospirillum lipoferum]MCP1614004.1 hypothetical protein [Azospirillum lipoferum]MDW5537604.1 hypothetical protein [Azospirillum sp. NL1]
MQTQKYPYEFLVRWDQTGQLSGAHVQHRYVILDDDGTKIGETLGPAEPLTLDTAAGFPLSAMLTQVQIDALTAKAAADAERDAAMVARDAALARVAQLEAQISEMPLAE